MPPSAATGVTFSIRPISPESIGGRPFDLSVEARNDSDLTATGLVVTPRNGLDLVTLSGETSFPDLPPGGAHIETIQIRTRAGRRYEPASHRLILNAAGDLGGSPIRQTIETTISFVTPTSGVVWGAALGAIIGLFFYHLLTMPGETAEAILSLPRALTGDPRFDLTILVRWGVIHPVAQTALAVFVAVFLATGFPMASKVGITVRGFRGAITVGVLSPWLAYDWVVGLIGTATRT
jgi:hypothetical protein